MTRDEAIKISRALRKAQQEIRKNEKLMRQAFVDLKTTDWETKYDTDGIGKTSMALTLASDCLTHAYVNLEITYQIGKEAQLPEETAELQ